MKELIELELQYGYIPSKDKSDFITENEYKTFIENEVTEYIKDLQSKGLLTEVILAESEKYELSWITRTFWCNWNI